MAEYREVRYHQLYRFCTRNDFILLAIGFLLAITTGFCQPLTFYAFGQITTAMIEKAKNLTCPTIEGGANPTTSTTTFMDQAETFVLFNAGVGLIQFIFGYVMVLCFNLVAENQAFRIRVEFFQNLIRQNIGFFDTEGKRDFSGRIIEDMLKIQESMSEKLGTCVFLIVNFSALTIQSFYTGWKLALVLTFVVPVIATVTWFQSSINSRLTAKELSAYSAAGSIAEEVLGNIKTVSAFNGAKLELKRYELALQKAKRFSYRKNFLLGFSNGLNWFFCFLNYSLAFYYGTLLVIESRESGDGLYGPRNLVVVFFGVLIAAYNIGQTMEYFEVFSAGTGAARGIFRILDKVSEIDSLGNKGLEPRGRSSGEIVFEEIEFSYPSRKSQTPILNKFSLSINPGQTVALVGKSGCGKSTCLSLLQRFYDPNGGRILVDGIDIRKLNLGWLRSQIGVVSQEPKLFNDTIYGNIALGKVGCSDMEILEAARDAYAHDFVSALPNGYFTPCGESGVELSGGEKQRIAIARSLVRNPPILLFDEATSALDFYSEAIVQAALERARQGRTTIIIAHRLSTIRTADVIVVMDNGEVVEQGTHEVLMAKRGYYYELVVTQEQNSETPDILEVIRNNFPSPPQQLPHDSNFLLKNAQALDLVSSISGKHSIKLKSLGELERKLEKDERKILLDKFRLRRFMSFLVVKEWAFMLTAILCTLIKSVNIPLYCLVFGKFIVLFALNDNTEILERGSSYAIMFLCIGFATGLSSFFQKFFAGLAGDSISLRVRKVCFAHILRQDLSFFCEPGNSIGQLTARLSTDATGIQGATSSRLVGLFQAVAIILFSVGVSIFLIPKMGLVVSLFVPLSVAGAFLEGKILSTSNVAEKEAVERSAAIAVEALSSIRTVASLGLEKIFIEAYKASLGESHSINKRRAHIRALIFGFVYGIPYFGYSLSLWYGAYLMETECASVAYIFMVAEALIYGIGSAGSALAYAPDYENGKISSGRVFKMLDRKPLIDPSENAGKKLGRDVLGKVGLDNVTFSYESRKGVKVLENASLTIRPGERVGLVGTSGSGKSTLVGLLLRFYDPNRGTVEFSDQDLRSLNVQSLRSQISIVQQEPILFDRTIAENINYGDTDRVVGMDQVIAAAKLARIHDFVVALPSGYETRVGALGNQISGGEKQRIAIARSIIRNPKLLILDEATSALDSESERSVQEALDELQNGTSGSMTVLTISHRLTSLRNSSKIMVLVDGRVEEEGTHAQLLDLKGAYYRLWSSQTQLNVTKG